MATWTTPRTYVVGEPLAAAVMNIHVRDNLTYLYDRLVLVVGTPESLPKNLSGETTGANATVPAGTWLLVVSADYLALAGGDRMVTRIRNQTDATTLKSVTNCVNGTRNSSTVVYTATFSAEKTVQMRAENLDSVGGSIQAVDLLALRTNV